MEEGFLHGLGDEWLVFVILFGLWLCGGHIAMEHVPQALGLAEGVCIYQIECDSC